jgi:hypothetical protein
MKARRGKLDMGKEARRRARKAGSAPAATRIIQDKRGKRVKHKKKWLERELD